MITVVIPVSPIKSHPDTAILTETLDSVRHHLPDAEVLLTFDGVRKEQEHRRQDYEEFIRRALWLADHKYGNVCPLIFDEHMHQSGMMQATLDEIRTPFLMYVEQDTPLVADRVIDFGLIEWYLERGESNLVRLHHEAVIPSDHSHLMLGMELDVPFLRTSQWSQRPHVASVAYYRRIMENYFTLGARCFIEDVMHGVLAQAHNLDGMSGWHQHRVHVYVPDRANTKYSYTTDGRAGEPKWDEDQIW